MAEKEKEKDVAAQTPSGLALEKVGKPKAGASVEELVAHARKYLDAKLKARRG
jgi:hypothetical protein